MSFTLFTICTMLYTWPNDFTVKYNYVSGTIPPPYHYEYNVSIDAKGNGIISYKPDYVFDTLWTETFKLPRKSIGNFWSLLKKNDFFEKKWTDAEKHPVGGSIEYLEITAKNKIYKIPAFPIEKDNAEKFLKAVRQLISKTAMDILTAKREKYIEKFKAEKN